MPDRGRISWKQPRPHQACALEAWSWRAIKLKLPPNSNHIFGTKSKQYSKHVWDNPIRYRPMISNALHDVATPPPFFFPSLSRRIHNSIFHDFPESPWDVHILRRPICWVAFCLGQCFCDYVGLLFFCPPGYCGVGQTNELCISCHYHGPMLFLLPCRIIEALRSIVLNKSLDPLLCFFLHTEKKSLGLSTISIWWVRYFLCAVL